MEPSTPVKLIVELTPTKQLSVAISIKDCTDPHRMETLKGKLGLSENVE
jgi:hypothetical protein